jgi:type I restriction enzyme M protein
MAAIEAENPALKGVLPRDYNRPALDKVQPLGRLYCVSGKPLI